LNQLIDRNIYFLSALANRKVGNAHPGCTAGMGIISMHAPDVAIILSEVETHLAQALALIDQHQLGVAAAPHIDLGLHFIRGERAEFNLPLAARSAD
jgi:hypothetical protein